MNERPWSDAFLGVLTALIAAVSNFFGDAPKERRKIQ